MAEYTGRYDYKNVRRGDTIRPLTFAYDFSLNGGAYGDLSLTSASMIIHTAEEDTVLEVGVTVSGNEVTVPTISDAVTITFPKEPLYYKLQVTRADGIKRTYLIGTLLPS